VSPWPVNRKMGLESEIPSRSAHLSNKQDAIVIDVQQVAVQLHQPGQEVFRAILREELEWKPLGLEYISAKDDSRNNNS
jgi:hypothetical protein